MKALVAAGGRGTRLRPITWTLNKHLIPLANKPMLANAIEKLVEAGVTEIGININPGDTEISTVFGDGSSYGAHITYLEQVGGPLGLAHIVKNAKTFLGDESFVFYLGDNIILGSLRRFIERLENDHLDVLLTLARVPDPQRFGVPLIENGKVIKVIEKPKDPPSDFAVSGIYFYSSKIHEACEAIPVGARGEYEISDAHTWMIEHGANVGFEEITGWWKDTGKPEDLLEGSQLLLNEMRVEDAVIDPSVTRAPDARIQGRVRIGKNTVIGENVLIRGPVAIGEGVQLKNVYIGPHTSIGDRVVVENAEIEHSIIMSDAKINAKTRIVDSILGKNAVIVSKDLSLPIGHRLVAGEYSYLEL